MPISMLSPITGAMPKVSGISSATPIVAVSPGSAPMTSPPKVPAAMVIRIFGSKSGVRKAMESMIPLRL